MKKMIFCNSRLARLILFDGYSTVMLFGFILTKQASLSEQTVRHETIHVRQWLECMLLAVPLMTESLWLAFTAPFIYYIWYLAEYLVRLLIMRNPGKAYRNIVFEREAYRNQADPSYLKKRLPFLFIKNYAS